MVLMYVVPDLDPHVRLVVMTHCPFWSPIMAYLLRKVADRLDRSLRAAAALSDDSSLDVAQSSPSSTLRSPGRVATAVLKSDRRHAPPFVDVVPTWRARGSQGGDPRGGGDVLKTSDLSLQESDRTRPCARRVRTEHVGD